MNGRVGFHERRVWTSAQVLPAFFIAMSSRVADWKAYQGSESNDVLFLHSSRLVAEPVCPYLTRITNPAVPRPPLRRTQS